jgi:hypothetical protein
MTVERQMPSYTCHKRVWALEIAAVGPYGTDSDGAVVRSITFKDEGFAPIVLSGDVFARYTPKPGDFYVVYEDGYKSFSPRKAFLDGYTEDGESFAEIKQGLKARNPE